MTDVWSSLLSPVISIPLPAVNSDTSDPTITSITGSRPVIAPIIVTHPKSISGVNSHSHATHVGPVPVIGTEPNLSNDHDTGHDGVQVASSSQAQAHTPLRGKTLDVVPVGQELHVRQPPSRYDPALFESQSSHKSKRKTTAIDVVNDCQVAALPTMTVTNANKCVISSI